ncbi:MAG: NUDIX hydrolase [Candidatus Wallbacteria bacterium]|nr:NUDIX hydrolase [Candidatus Wallbacteria bacterium]
MTAGRGGAPRGPALTVDLLIVPVEEPGGVVLVRRRYEPVGWALPGGFVDHGETVEAAAIREAKEETGLDVTLLRQFHVYSDPARDARQHTVSVVFVAAARGRPAGADDAAEARVFSMGALPEPIVFDHAQILEDFVQGRY